MSRGIAPIKQEYIKIVSNDSRESTRAAARDVKQAGMDNSKASKVAVERKSRRAFKKVCRPMTPTCVEHLLTSAASIHASECPVLRSHASIGRKQEKRGKQASAADSFGASVLLETTANSATMWRPILPASLQTCLASAHTLLPLSVPMVSQAWSTVHRPRTLFLSITSMSASRWSRVPLFIQQCHYHASSMHSSQVLCRQIHPNGDQCRVDMSLGRHTHQQGPGSTAFRAEGPSHR